MNVSENYDTEVAKHNRRIFDLKMCSDEKIITPEQKNLLLMRIESSGGRSGAKKRSHTQVKEMLSYQQLRN
jgi:hypothetical protein